MNQNKGLSCRQEREARAGIEPANRGFADPCLTTWLPRRLKIFGQLANLVKNGFAVNCEHAVY